MFKIYTYTHIYEHVAPYYMYIIYVQKKRNLSKSKSNVYVKCKL
jgi:hypothetical protein